MPIASGAGHWPKEHIVATVVEKVANPSGPSYVQSYMPQYTAPNKIIPHKPAYITQGPPSPPPTSLYPKYPNQPSTPSNGQPYPQYDTPPPRYSSAKPPDSGREGPGSPPRNGGERQQPWGRNPNQNPQSRPPRSWRATEKYGQGGHHRFGNGGQSTRTEFGHNRYGVRYNSSRQVQFNPKGSRPVGPKGLESYEMYGPRMNMTTGCCGPQMRPLWAMLGGLLALGALGGIIAGIVLGVKANTPVVRNTGYVNPLGSVRYYLQNGAFEPCFNRYATTTTAKPTTPIPTTTPLPTTTPKPTPSTTHCIPLTFQTVEAAAVVPVTTAAVSAANGTTKTTQKPTVVTTTVCLWTPAGPTTTQASTTTPPTTTTTPVPTTTPPPTTTTTLPFCDTLTTTYTLITLNPLPSPIIYYSGTPRLNSHVGAGFLILLLAFATKLFVD